MSLLRRTYYQLKPWLPHGFRMAARRRVASHLLRRSGAEWPIKYGSQTPPANWSGWPNGKKFAVVLTHDVESRKGLDRCLQLADLEAGFGFRSSFNFIPEGEYSVPASLRTELVRRGFEVGVHDLYHDGKLYRSHDDFRIHAAKINQYLNDWNAVGFRSGFMHHNLDWLHDLDIAYDLSTFDTDPFEPQPDGVNTIFPFWVPAPNSSALNDSNSSTLNFKPSTLNDSKALPSTLLDSGEKSHPSLVTRHSPLASSDLQPSAFNLKPSAAGYVELPYTLPQDSTLFLLLGQTNISIWKRKLAWIAQHGGMALLNVHPDYINFDGVKSSSEYPLALYSEFLKHLRSFSADSAWFVRPSEVARWAAQLRLVRPCLSRKRVCMVSYSFYQSDNRVMRYAEALANRGDSVDVIALRKDSAPRRDVLNGVRVRHIQRRERNEKGKLAYLTRILRFLVRGSAVLSWKHLTKGYDVVHVHNVPDFLVFSAWLPKFTGARIILDIHDLLPEFFASKFKSGPKSSWYVERLIDVEGASCRFAHHVIISNHLWHKKVTARSVLPEHCTAIVNHVDSSVFCHRARTRRDEKFIAIFPGGLQAHQGLDVAIRAFVHVIRELPHAEFHIYGDGNMKEEWVALVRELCLEKHVLFFKPLPLHEIAEKIANADIGLVPKRADSFGNEAYSTKIMEFMSQGIPVVGSRTKIDTFYFNDSQIAFFESGNHEQMAEKILSVLHDSALADKLISNGLVYVARNNWETKKHDYFAIVDAVAPTSKTPTPKTPDTSREPVAAAL